MRTKITLVLTALFLVLALPAQAADFHAPTNKKSGNLQLSENLKSRNLYAAGAQVSVNASPEKDLTVAGGTVNVNANVGDDLLAAGGNINIRGNIGGSARVVGGNVYVEGQEIAEDLVIGGSTIYIAKDTVVKGDLVVGANSVIVDGTVEGNVKAGTGTLTLNGRVLGNVEAKISRYIELGPDAVIEGDLNYTAPYLVERDPAAQIQGQINYTAWEKNAAPFLTAAFFIQLLAILLVALVLMAFWGNSFKKFVVATKEGFWGNVVRGLVAAIVMPLLAMLLFFTFIGYYLSFIIVAAFALLIMLGCVVGVAYFGSWVFTKIEKKDFKVSYYTVILGIVLVYIAKLIPFIGWALGCIVALAGFGAIIKVLSKHRKGE